MDGYLVLVRCKPHDVPVAFFASAAETEGFIRCLDNAQLAGIREGLRWETGDATGVVVVRFWGVRLFISDRCLGLVEALGEFYPEAAWQRCAVHFSMNAFPASTRSASSRNCFSSLALSAVKPLCPWTHFSARSK